MSLDCIYFRHQFFEEGLNVLWTLRQSSCTFLASRRGCFHGRKRKAFFWFDEIPGAIDRGTGFSLGNSFRWNLKCVMRRKWKGIEQNIQSLIRILLDQKDSQDIVVKNCCETSKKLCWALQLEGNWRVILNKERCRSSSTHRAPTYFSETSNCHFFGQI